MLQLERMLVMSSTLPGRSECSVSSGGQQNGSCTKCAEAQELYFICYSATVSEKNDMLMVTVVL